MKKILILFLILWGIGLVVNAQNSVKGTIVDSSDKNPLIGATVYIKGTTTGTITDAEGKFQLNATNNSTLVFSFIGYKTKEVVYTGQTSLNVSLNSDVSAIDEVVVVGYGTQKKSHLTGAVSKVTNENLDEVGASRLDQALQGKISGVQIQNVSSEAGSAPVIRVRGLGSISANSSPLVVLDGHPIAEGLEFVNMSDVESVEVLKDAASSAIYGSRGANGVIIITTKTGAADKPKYSFKTMYGVRSAIKLNPVMTFTEYMNLLYSDAALRATDPSVAAASVNLATEQERGGYVIEQALRNGEATDWQSQAIREAAPTSNVQLSVSGGKKDLVYYVSGNYQSEDGLMYHSTYDKMSLRAKLGGQLGKHIKFNLNLNPTYSKSEKPSVNFTDFFRTYSWLLVKHTAQTAAWVNQNPNISVQEGDWAQARHFSSQIYSGTMPDGSDWNSVTAIDPWTTSNNSPKSIMETNTIFVKNYRMTNSADVTISLAKGLDFKAAGSAYVAYSETTNNAMANSKKEGDLSYRLFQSEMNIDLLSENTLNFNKTIGNHDFSILAGFTAQNTENKYTGIAGSGFPSDDISTITGATQLDAANTSTTSETIRLISLLSRVNYSYKSKYMLSASLRGDGSSYFSNGNKWGAFPAISLGWRISEENFMKSATWLDMLKLRASYGATGNNRIQNYSYTNLLYSQNYSFGTGTGSLNLGLSPTNTIAGNNLITWERTFESNIGVDMTFLNQRVNFTAEYYDKQTEKLLFSQGAMSFSGYNQYWNNIGKVQNRGFEFDLSTINVKKKDFQWKTTFNLSTNANKLLELGGEPYQYNYGERNEIYAAIVGQPAIQFFGYKTDGIWKTQAEIDEAKLSDTGTNVSKYFTAGGLKSVDTNKDGKITSADRVAIGSPFPDFIWGIGNTINYKGIDLSFMFQGSQGNKVLNGDAYYNETKKLNTNYTNNRWISELNPGDGKTPYYTNGQDWMLTDYVVEDGSYVALREVVLGYELPARLNKLLHINSSRLYVSGQNLLYFMANGYRGINPEARSTSSQYASPLVDGYQRGSFPLSRTILMGLDINF